MVGIFGVIYLVSGLLKVSFHIITVCLTVSFWTGQMIVRIFLLLATKWLEIVKQLALGFQILYEDFGFFVNDVINKLMVLHDCIISTLETIGVCYTNSKCLLGSISNSVLMIANSLLCLVIWGFRSLYNFVVLVKQAFILIGLTIWTSIELIPLLIVYCTSVLLVYSRKFIWGICSIVETLYMSALYIMGASIHFIKDIPLKAAGGIILGFAFMYLIRKYHKRIIQFFIVNAKRAFIKMFRLVRHILHGLFIINFWRLVNGWCQNVLNYVGRSINYDQDQHSQANSSTRENYSDDNLCVVCLDRRRNTIFLPCRHLCVCWYCSHKVRTRNYQCPICREDINETLSVYY